MTEVRSDNFNKLLPDILRAIKKAKFIAIDTEFTALYVENKYKPSLFDTGEERYTKLRNTVQRSIPIQIGLSAFHFNSIDHTYQVETFTFYIWPQPIMSVDHLIQIQSSSFQFLSRSNFDYNKLIYNGIPFLNKNQEVQVNEDFQKNSWPLESPIEEYLDNTMHGISEWYTDAKETDTYVVTSSGDSLKYDVNGWYHVQSHLRKIYPGIWTKVDQNNMLVLERVSSETFENNQMKDNLKTRTINLALGFTHVFRALVAAKKPIIGHNLLMDLLFLQSTFGENLPKSYNNFKRKVHEDFPLIIDTKCLSIDVFKMIPHDLRWQKSALQNLYDFFIKGKGKELNFMMPLIKAHPAVEERYHHAGWDSYCAGVLFINMAHFLVIRRLRVINGTGRDIMCSEYFDAVQPVVNQVNLIRSVNSYMNICGADPKSTRPPRLVAISCKDDLDILRVSQELSNHGFVEIKQINSQRAVICVASSNAAINIMKTFSNTPDYRIKIYRSILHHSLAVHFQVITASVFIIGAIGVVSRLCKLY